MSLQQEPSSTPARRGDGPSSGWMARVCMFLRGVNRALPIAERGCFILVERFFLYPLKFVGSSMFNLVARMNSTSVVKDQLSTPWPKPHYYGLLLSLRSIAKEEE